MTTEIIKLEQQQEAVYNELKHAEDSIERVARNAFQEWGAQLKHIRTGKLYLVAGYPTWEAYCSERWEMSDSRANQLIDAYETTAQLKTTLVGKDTTNSCVLPMRETHARPLTKLDTPEQRAEVWQRVVDNSNGSGITAKKVTDEVTRYKAEMDKKWITLTEWNELEADEQQRILTQTYPAKSTFNPTNDNVEWARYTWNPITGCLHNCDYCYARDIATRFFPQNFEPSFLPSRLSAPANTPQKDLFTMNDPIDHMGYRNVFVCSMADLFGKWVPPEWIEAVLTQIRNNPQWTFLLLSKFPVRMAEFDYPKNVWLGTTVDKQHTVDRAEKAFTKIKQSGFNGTCWLSCEPMLERLTFNTLEMFDWVVMGGSSKSTQTQEYYPPFDDIVHLYTQARDSHCQIYFKTNLLGQRIREYPKIQP